MNVIGKRPATRRCAERGDQSQSGRVGPVPRLPDHRHFARRSVRGIPFVLRPEHNVLALVSSSDLKRWKVHTIVLQHPDRRHHAWQYVDWRFDGDDIVAVSRTAWGDSHNFHDANYLTFHRINDFRRLVY
jgi:hypothetical protein